MATLRIPDLRTGYIDVADYVLEHGRKVSPRGDATYEVIAPTIILEDPTDALPLGVGRKISFKIAAVEAAQLIAGRAYPKLVLASSSNFAQFAEDDATFHGNYGARIGNQLRSVFYKLKNDPSTRQAVITLWNPTFDNLTGKRDYPCTVGFQFMIRDDKLHMIAIMRSNDVWWGLAYDMFQFAQLQITLAKMLGVAVGELIHRPGSLHIYERNIEEIENLEATGVSRYNPRGIGRSDFVYDLEARDRAIALLEGNPLERETVSEKWYRVQLDALREKVNESA